MDLFKWIGVGTSNHSTSNARNRAKSGGVKPINHADYKQFGLENFGNTCYANAVLQSLYFCQPFRELVCDSHDRSNPPIPLSLLALPPPLTVVPPPQRPVKGFRRRDSTTDGGKSADEALPNGHSVTSPGRPSTSSASGVIPIPATPPTLFSALRSLFLHIALNPLDKGTVSPLTFINKLKKENELYRSSMHQDAHEFFNFLLNKIVEDLEAEMKKNAEMGEDLSHSLTSLPPPASSSSSTAAPSQSNQSNSTSSDSQGKSHPHMTFVHSLFEGTLTSETRCLTCETVSSRDESFLDLSIDIEQNSSVTACLRQFSASEMLSHKNKFFCDSCGGLQEAEKRMKIKKLPNVLALHLKRFKYQEDVQKYIKLAYRVAFPFELRLFNTVDDADDPDRLYQLFAIVVHIGGGPHHGHYIAIVKAHETWLVFDDDSVEPIRQSDISKYFGESPGGAGYVLFYQAADLDLASVGIDPTPASASDVGENGVDAEAESSGDSEPVASRAPASVPHSVSSHVPLKQDVPIVLEPDPPSAAPPSTPSVASNASGGFFSNVSLGRTLRHSQSIKIGSDKRRAASQSAHDADPPTLRPLANGDTSPVSPSPTSPLTHSRSLRGKDKDRDGTGSWFGGRRKDKKEKRPALPVPPLPADDLSPVSPAERERTRHDVRRPSAPGQLERERERDPSPLGRSSLLGHDHESSVPSSSPAPSPPAPPSALPAVTPSPLPSPPLPSPLLSPRPPPLPPKSPMRPMKSPSKLPSSQSAVDLRSSARVSPLLVPPVPVPPVSAPPVSFPPVPVPPVAGTPARASPPSPRMRKMSQVLQPTRTEVPPADVLRPSTAGAKPKRASRKMSLSAMPLGGMFGRKDKDKDRSTPSGRPPSTVVTAPESVPNTSLVGRAV